MRWIVIGASMAFASHILADPEVRIESVMGKAFMPAVATPQRSGHVSVHPGATIVPADRGPIKKFPTSNSVESVSHLEKEIAKLEETNERMQAELEGLRSQIAIIGSPKAQTAPIIVPSWRKMVYGFRYIGYGVCAAFLLSIIYKFVKRNWRDSVISMSPVEGVQLQSPRVFDVGGHLHPRRLASPPRMMASPEAKGEITAGVGAGRDLPSPSGINTYPLPLQAATVLGIAAAIGLLTALLAGPGFDAVRGSFLWNLSRPTWPILGLIYLAAGVAHFTEADGFENITPPNGTWGIYATPFSPRFNVYWTGVVEIFGGAWMLFGAGAAAAGIGLPAALGPVVSDAALTLFLLTILVTPANIYALTHGANFPLDIQTPPKAHAVRLVFQAVLLALFWEMAQPTLLDAKVNLGLM